ncbi:MAG: phosphoribosylglycinamide formyltransferase [Rhodospirillales bacterium]|nr:phosphoribosylglycinamide formyltransferase [Rhodospirillales bacterium]MCB9964601.1 phosphoribosylglycinamide formyltransferase [Rhodospirillales bacterium]
MRKVRTGVLLSGSGSNLQALIDACRAPEFPAEISCVISNKETAYGLTRAEQAGIPAVFVSHKGKSREEFAAEIDDILTRYTIDMVCLAGFMRILSADFFTKWDNRMLNIHPALLPKFGGEGMYGHHVHEAVIAAGETESGASVHVVTAGCDEGPVVLQEKCPVLPEDTPDTLAARVLTIEHQLYPRALQEYVLRNSFLWKFI